MEQYISHKSGSSYLEYVKTQSIYNPCLFNLENFLSNHADSHGRCRVITLDFRQGIQGVSSQTLVDLNDLPSKLQSDNNHESPLQGRIFIIEDLTKEVVELLGSRLDVDPLFFAMHLHVDQRRGLKHHAPSEATLPTRLLDQNYINMSYHRSVMTDSPHDQKARYLRNTAINRKLVLIPSSNLGLVQHCASIIRTKQKYSFWTGRSQIWYARFFDILTNNNKALALVDPPVDDFYFANSRKDEESKVQFFSKPYLGLYEDFMLPSDHGENFQPTAKPRGTGIADGLAHYWERRIPCCFDAKNPTIQSLAYYPLRIIAAEWVKYIAVMQECLVSHEYRADDISALAKFEMRLRELQSWRRRTLLSQRKIQSILSQLNSWKAENPNDTPLLQPLIIDYQYISLRISECGQMLEHTVPTVTSAVQIFEARRAFIETANITRLTVLALIFIPLNYVSSLFSMQSSNAPGNSRFWVYFVVAIPLTLLVLGLSQTSVSWRAKALIWFIERRKGRSERSEKV